MVRKENDLSQSSRTGSFIRRALVLSVFTVVATAQNHAFADIHAACAKCGKWVVISTQGAGFARNHFMVCGACLERAGQDLRDDFHDVNERLKNKRRQKPSYEKSVEEKQKAVEDHVNRERADHERRGFGYTEGLIRNGEGVRHDDRLERLKNELAREQRTSDTVDQQIKDLENQRVEIVKKFK